MKITLTKTLFVGSRSHRSGDAIELPDDRAKELIGKGLATASTEAPPDGDKPKRSRRKAKPETNV
ncbi:MAG: hypothetical protein AAFX76_13145 [Planctomycetota bacterium]